MCFHSHGVAVCVFGCIDVQGLVAVATRAIVAGVVAMENLVEVAAIVILAVAMIVVD